VQDRVWDELGRIDYFLDQLARAVERGEVPRESYETLAPRYLERRADLMQTLESRAERAATIAAAAVPRRSEPRRAVHHDDDAWPVAVVPAPPRRAARPAAPPREPVAVSTLLAYVGALLVVVAAAIFTVYNWGTLSPVMKLASLAGVTLVFYAGGESVRVGLKLPVIGVALLGVGSAMLLFDGWMLITALGLTGMLPWACVLIFCSAVYFLTELRVAGHWFGAIGAAAQVAWWWLLGRGLGWDTAPILTGLSIMALVWVVLGMRTPREGPLATLRTVLTWAGPALAALVAGGALVLAGTAASWSYADLAQVVAVAVILTVTLELDALTPDGVAVVAVLPAIAAAVHLRLLVPASWPVIGVVLGCLAVTLGAYAVWRRRAPYAAAALVVSVAALLLGLPGGGRPEALPALLGALALAWVCVARILPSAGAESARDSAGIWSQGGGGLLAVATILIPVVCGGLPLAGVPVTAAHLGLAVGASVAWAVVCVLWPRFPAGWGVFAGSFYGLAAVLAFAAPHAFGAWYAMALMLLALAWSQADPLPERFLHLDSEVLAILCEGLLIAIPLGGLGAPVAWLMTVLTWPASALLVVTALAWLAEGLRRRRPYAFAVAAGWLVAAAGVAAATGAPLETAALAAAATAVLVTAAGWFDRGPGSSGAFAAASAAGIASVGAAAAAGHPGVLTAALMLVALAWTGAALVGEMPELVLPSVAFAWAGVLAALALVNAGGGMTVLAGGVLAAALLGPTALTDARSRSEMRTRLVRALAVAGAAVLASCVIFGAGSWLMAGPVQAWWVIGWGGLAITLVLAGAYVIVWSWFEGVENGTYVGTGAFLLALWVLLHGVEVTQAEMYLVPAALYFAAMGYLWASRGEGREVPQPCDIAAVGLGVVWPFLLSVAAFDTFASYTHAILALAFAVVAVMCGLFLRTRVYFLTGLAIAALDSLWLSREFLFALPKWLLIGAVGVALIGVGLGYASRQAGVGEAAERMREALADWR
jgi:hypothetical protein